MKKRIRKFIVTVEEVEDDPSEVTHQQLPPIQTRDADEPKWFQRKGRKRTPRPARSE